jgi:thiol-disulfide isomerase/thioredoxin
MKIKRLSLLAIILLLCVPSFAQGKRKAKVKAKPVAAQPAGPAFEVKYIKNDELRQLLTRTAGQKPLLVNFWATWCEPCIEEFPDLVKIDAEYKPRGLEFITISLDETEELNKGVPKFLGRVKSTMPAYLLDLEKQEEAFDIIDRDWPGALPFTLLYDGNGQVVFKRSGKLNIAELRGEIEKIVNK